MTDTSQTSFRENLTDAGCCEESIRLCESLRREGKTAELLKFLTEQRKRLLDALHREQKQIDCLDYLVCKVRKETLLKERQRADPGKS